MHQTAVGSGASISGVFQWNNAGTNQLVAIANGDIFYKTTDYGAFSSVSPTPALASTAAVFSTMRQSSSGAPLRLYLTDGTNYWRWTGSAISKFSGVSSLPANTTFVKTYHIRNFLATSDYGNHLFWSVLGDPEDGTVGDKSQGGSAMVDVLRGEDITALEVIGNSLLIGTSDSVSRFTGYSSDDIKIESDTEGVTSNLGPVGPRVFLRIEQFVAMLADVGPYAITEAEEVYLGDKVKDTFNALDRSVYSSSVIGYHKGRREIWWAVPGASDSATNKTVYVYAIDLGAWYGPFTYPFAITCMTSYEDANGDESIVAGCADGFVRHLDTGYLDDVLYDASGGSTYDMSVELAPTYFPEVGPGVLKTLQGFTLTANLGTSDMDIEVRGDEGDWSHVATLTGVGDRSEPYRVDAYKQGDYFGLRLSSTASEAQIVRGVSWRGWNMLRPSESGY
jgi:hypothetical protein